MFWFFSLKKKTKTFQVDVESTQNVSKNASEAEYVPYLVSFFTSFFLYNGSILQITTTESQFLQHLSWLLCLMKFYLYTDSDSNLTRTKYEYWMKRFQHILINLSKLSMTLYTQFQTIRHRVFWTANLKSTTNTNKDRKELLSITS